MSLTKDHLIISVRDYLDIPKVRSTQLIESLLEIMKRCLADGEAVLISGFGKFYVKDKTVRKGRNPQTDRPMLLRSRRVVTFKCSPVLRKKLNGTGEA